MTLNPSNPRTKPRWLISAAVVGLLTFVLAGVAMANLSNGTTFELDGDPQDPTAPTGSSRNTPVDWSSLFPSALTPVGFLDRAFIDDHASIEETYFFGGSTKDDIDIDTVAGDPGSGGWLRDKTSSAQAKADIIDAFAASYQVDGDTIVYFGMDRFSNDGATFAGFWFLKNSISFGPTANNRVGEIHGSHAPGDILVITDFTQGGAVEKLNVYEWVGPNSGLPNVINGVFILKYAGTDCASSAPDADACSKVNSGEVDSPWPFVPKFNIGPAGKFQPGLFIEGGVNISDLFPNENPCFTNFVAETRASFSIDSTLSDFAFGNFDTCGGIDALKYHDLNADGDQDAGEPPLEGWTIFVDADGDEELDAGELSGTTDEDGLVSFTSLTAGTYSVCEVLESGWLNSDPGGSTVCEDVTVGTGGAVASVDFGNYQNVTVKVIKYHDLNANGSQQAGEPFLQNWNFYIENGANEVQNLAPDGTDGAYQATNASGETTFTLTPGSAYKICEELKTGWLNSDPSGTTICESTTTVVSGQTQSDLVFGNYQNVTVKVIKYHDLNASGTKDAGEPLLQNWNFYIENGANEVQDLPGDGAYQATDASGETTFTLTPGSAYEICEELQSNWVNTDPTGTTICESTATIVSGTAQADLVFGNYQNVTVKVIKYHDRNADGVRDADGLDNILGGAGAGDDEVLLPGWDFYVEVGANEIHNDGIDGAKQTTNASGESTFTLTPGAAYKICEVLQSNWVNTDPTGTTICESTATIASGTAQADLVFGNHPEYRVIVLTCSEATGELVVSTVDLDGAGTTHAAKDSIGVPPTLTGKTAAELQTYLCNLGGAQYDDLAPQTFNNGKVILPK